MIISGGENIHPTEIEYVLEQHPNISEAAVVGTADEKWGEVPVAVVVPARGVLDEASLRAHLDQNLGRYKHPRHILSVDALPRTGLDKIAYPQVSKFVEAQLRDLESAT